MKENSFTLVNTRSIIYLVQTISDVDYTDDITRLANAPCLVESLLHSLERAAGGVVSDVKADK